MLLQSEGIVLHSIKYGENSQISKILSKEKGLLSVISSRSKSKKNKQGNYFQPLSPIHFVCYLSNKTSIHRLKEIGFNTKINAAKEDVVVDSIRFFLAEFLSKVIKEEEQNFTLYHFIEEELTLLFSDDCNPAFFHIDFLFKLYDQIGITPDFSESGQFFDFIEGSVCASQPTHPDFCDGNQKVLLEMLAKGQKSFSKTERNILLNLLIAYYNIQLGGGLEKLKSKAVLEVVFS